MADWYAHSVTGAPVERWHRLEEHLKETARRAEEFAGAFSPGWGRLAGLWHDAGKYRLAFQDMIRKDAEAHVREKVDHGSVGAVLALERKVQPLAFVIAGHHGGLGDCERVRERLAAKAGLLAEARRDGLPGWVEGEVFAAAPEWVRSDRRKLALWVRMVFSAVVDADFLDTERFYKGAERELPRAELGVLLERLVQHLAEKEAAALATPVNEMRARILRACREAAMQAPGVFTLTVPTGGGKTLSSLEFALRHAIEHQLRRVIVVIPFTSITEQTAGVYRQALGEGNVIEHHSNVDPDRETRTNRLASENWDAPVIVTTSVQFFESLYANRPSRCRKLHRVARSVVVFDEVQTFPAKLLEPIRDVLGNLVADYGVSVVFCTATQPALGLDKAREIVREAAREFAVVAGRCRIELPRAGEVTEWEELAAELRAREQVLAIVNRRDDAEKLARLTGSDCLHLSARMCAAHRSAVLEDVKRRLKAGERCRVVATQLVEAGVDVDFPEVFRAFAGADSLAQAAGRCNREGLLEAGHVRVFFPVSEPPAGFLRTAAQIARMMWEAGILNLKAPGTFERYFELLYSRVEQDPGVMAAERGLCFEQAAEKFRMIEEKGEAVVAPYGEGQRRAEEIRCDGVSRLGLRRLQPFVVNLYRQEIERLVEAGAIERLDDRLWTVVKGFEHIYDRKRFGFGWKGVVAAEPEALIA